MIARVRSALRLPAPEQAALARALAAALAVEAGLRVLSLGDLARRLGVRLEDGAAHRGLESGPAPRGPADGLGPDDVRRVRAVERVFRSWPVRKRCLRRSLALGYLLRRRRPVLRIGVGRDERGAIHAHAWIEVGGTPLGRDAHFRVLRAPGGNLSE